MKWFFVVFSLVALPIAVAPARAQSTERETKLRAYLDAKFDCRIERIDVTKEDIIVRGKAPADSKDLLLAPVPMHADAFDIKAFGDTLGSTVPIAVNESGEFEQAIPLGNLDATERLLSRWMVVRREGEALVPASHAHYYDSIACSSPPALEAPRNKKGVGALGLDRPVEDIYELGIGAVTVNIVLNGLIQSAPDPENEAPEGSSLSVEFAGRHWRVNEGYLKRLDATLKFAASKKLIVSAIVLISPANRRRPDPWTALVSHPDARRSAFFAMPNVNDEEGLIAYAAALDILARRYNGSNPEHGRIHHWIMHNEVDQGWTWTNAGEKTALEYFDLYHKSLRLAHLVARQYDPHAQAFISLTHHWTVASDDKSYTSKEMLDLLRDFCRAEGDFDWAVAHHPYPEDLRDPRVWEDEHVNFTLETPKITFKNIEVLDAWARKPENMFEGRLRTIHLSEQGFNSPDYSEKSLNDQAAGMAYAWAKIEPLKSIQIFHYHNWVDNRGEFGLRIGLRRFPDDADEPLGRKPIWHVFQAAGSPNQGEAHAFALPIVGLKDWTEARHTQPIE